MRIAEQLLPLGLALSLLACASSPAVVAQPPSVGLGVAQLQRDALAVRSMVRSRWAVEFLEQSGQLPAIAPRRILHAPDGKHSYTERQVESLPGPVQRQFREETVDETGYYYGTSDAPAFFARLLDLLGENENRSLVGRRIIDLNYTALGGLRMMAAAGAIAVGVSNSWRLRALYGQPSDQGAVPLFGRDAAGQLALVSGEFPGDAATRTAVGISYDAVVVKNLLKRGLVHPAEAATPDAPSPLGVSDEAYLRSLNELLRQGGRLIVYNLCPAPAPPGQPYNPQADCRNAFSQAAWQAAGFRVLDYDRSDTPAARDWGRALGWDRTATPINLETNLFALYTLVERP